MCYGCQESVADGCVGRRNTIDSRGLTIPPRGASRSQRGLETRQLGVSEMEIVWESLAEGEALELLAEAAEAHALAQELAKTDGYGWAVFDLERYAITLEAMAR